VIHQETLQGAQDRADKDEAAFPTPRRGFTDLRVNNKPLSTMGCRHHCQLLRNRRRRRQTETMKPRELQATRPEPRCILTKVPRPRQQERRGRCERSYRLARNREVKEKEEEKLGRPKQMTKRDRSPRKPRGRSGTLILRKHPRNGNSSAIVF
jgi:hypothetical protein